MFKGTFELFSFKIERGCLEFELPETHQTASSQFSIERVRGHAPFDIQLILKDDPRGPYVYYSKSSEADRDGQILEAKLAAIRATN